MNGRAGSDTIPAATLLDRLTGELHRCTQLLAGIEGVVMPMIRSGTVSGGSVPHAMQDIDLLGQCLDDIAACLAAVASSPALAQAAPLRADLLGILRLADMRFRLEGSVTVDTTPGHAVELF